MKIDLKIGDEEGIIKEVKKFSTSSHVLLPKEYVGKIVKISIVEVKEK
jgi:putative transposon-encoded protein